MFSLWLELARLATDVQQVVWLRMLKLSKGGPASAIEMQRMVSEKAIAAAGAAALLMTGASSSSVVRSYRKKVRSNRRRLTKRAR